jgi:CRISPR-associated endonuclease/helicase Cas3
LDGGRWGVSDLKRNFIAHRRESDGKEQSLEEHLEETAELAKNFAAKIGLDKLGELVGLLHDLGKVTDEFDKYIRSATGLIDPDEDDYVDAAGRKGKIDHSSAGAQVIYRHFSNKGNESLFLLQFLSLVIASHHSGLIDCLIPDGNDNYSRRLNKAEEKTRTTEAWNNLDEKLQQRVKGILADNELFNQLKQALVLMRENDDLKDTAAFKIGLLVKFLFSCLIDADRLDTADFEFPKRAKLRNQGKYYSWQTLIERLDRRLNKFENKNEVDVIRQDISNYCFDFANREKGLYQLTVPTGGGKTLSSLRFALNHAAKYDMDRIIYIIPYTSIIDQNADTVRKILEVNKDDANRIVLEHHSNLTPDEESTRQKLLSENWDAPVIFTTMVQFLEALFGYGTRNARRTHQLANAIIIFDEIQTLPIKCVHLFNLTIRFLIRVCGSSVVLCTATQPLLDRVKPEQRALLIKPEHQMMPDVQKLFKDLNRVKVYDQRKIGGWTEQEVADFAGNEVQKTRSVLIIVNTKKAALGIFNQLQGISGVAIYHLSTSMCPAHRMNILNDIKKCLPDKKPVICVSTQLIEAGVDIDFGSVIRYLAGLDSIAQAAGRCNRNGTRYEQGRVFIVNHKDENLDKLKDIKIGRDKTERVLEEYKANPKAFDNDIIGLKSIESYYQYYFYEQKEEMCYQVEGKSEIGRSDNLFELLSSNQLSVKAYQRINNQSCPPIPIRQSFMSAAKAFRAIDSSARGVIVPYGEAGKRIIAQLCGTQELEKKYKLLKAAQRYSVNVFSGIFDKLVKQGIIREVQQDVGVYYLDDQYYSDACGVSESPIKEMEVLNC